MRGRPEPLPESTEQFLTAAPGAFLTSPARRGSGRWLTSWILLFRQIGCANLVFNVHTADSKAGKPAPARMFASQEGWMSERPFPNQRLNPSPKAAPTFSEKINRDLCLHPTKTLKNGLNSSPTNGTRFSRMRIVSDEPRVRRH